MTKFENIDNAIMSLKETDLLHVIMYNKKNFDSNMNIRILTATLKLTKDS